eukprot:TRINITY_DN3837_c0_g1_i1.p2 TRINITY_DN3837_c0_g1~~TRINITY_DN3837_c0_g1_i1.p2  ORF type:complete len:417 (-),score=164.26 TRINITY_DN3837_c0_g1_i1:40-1290(-)
MDNSFMDQAVAEKFQSDIDASVARVAELKANKAEKVDVKVAVELMNKLRVDFKKAKDDALKEAMNNPPPEIKQRFENIRGIAEECIQDDDLMKLLLSGKEPLAYDGFEPSGRMHIAQGVLKSINVNKLTQNGCRFVFWVADWFALMNNKMGGDLERIKTVGRYMIEVWKSTGMDMSKVDFKWSSDEINSNSNEYWLMVMDIARRNSLNRITKCCQIMGRLENNLSAAQIFYPCMQCADIFFLKADICQLGMDQRKVNMLAREYAEELKLKHKPVILSHPMMMGLAQGQEKMSKSDPNSAIFMEDSEQAVNKKMKQAFCPVGIVEANPVLNYCKIVVFPKFGSLTILRKEENGGNQTYESYEALEADFVAEKLHPGDLKPAVSKSINAMLDPVRQHFKNDKNAAALLKKVKGYTVTK